MTDHSIGAFSALSRISIRMLRHYDEHGLLKPASVDPDTGYRRYSDAQLADALRIRRLRDVGFSVSAIGAVTATDEEDGYRRALILQHEALQHEPERATLDALQYGAQSRFILGWCSKHQSKMRADQVGLARMVLRPQAAQHGIVGLAKGRQGHDIEHQL